MSQKTIICDNCGAMYPYWVPGRRFKRLRGLRYMHFCPNYFPIAEG